MYRNSTLDVKALIALVAICLIIFLPICIFTPSYYADDGGYARMLDYFVETGKVDLMRWSQPTAIGLMIVAAPLRKMFNCGFVQLDIIGLFFSIAALSGLYVLLRQQLSVTMSFLLTWSIFCFNEIVFVTPTFMTDMPFLAYWLWWLVLTCRLLADEGKLDARMMAGWSTLLVLSLLTRGTGLFILPALIAAGIFCSAHRRRLLILVGAFFVCWLIASLVTRFMTINSLSFMQTTALREIFQLHDLARFNLRAAAVAALSVVFAVSPILMMVKNTEKKLWTIQLCIAVAAAAGTVYFQWKGFFHPLESLGGVLVVLSVAYGAYHLPSVALTALRNDRPLSVVLITMTVFGLGIMPIMAHPLTRHAIPAMVSVLLLTAKADSWKPNVERLIFVLASLLIFNNIVQLQHMRLVGFAAYQIAENLLKQGFKPKDIDAGWAWFCYEALVPGTVDPENYVTSFSNWQENAQIAIGSEDNKKRPVLTHLEVRQLLYKIDLSLTENRSSSN